MSSAESIAESAITRAAKNIIKGSAAALSGKKRGPDRRVRRGSVDVDDPRARVWRPVNGGQRDGGLRWRDALKRTAREYDLVGEQKGKRAPLGPYTRDVLAALLDLVDFATGRLEPTYAKLMALTGFAKSTVGDALRRLKAHGFLDWLRRSRVIDDPDGAVRRQTSNAFFFELGRLPRAVLQRFRDLLSRAERAAAVRAGGPAGPSPAPALVKDPELAATIARIQAYFDAEAE